VTQTETMGSVLLDMDLDVMACDQPGEVQDRDEQGRTPYQRVADRLGFDYEAIGETVVTRVQSNIAQMFARLVEEMGTEGQFDLMGVVLSNWIEGFMAGVSFEQRKDANGGTEAICDDGR